ncbi:hypothetical protein Taro_045334, partial [Colocasia esculenta]|nr:hypothetical protein [Colocasia esculenta]
FGIRVPTRYPPCPRHRPVRPGDRWSFLFSCDFSHLAERISEPPSGGVLISISRGYLRGWQLVSVNVPGRLDLPVVPR